LIHFDVVLIYFDVILINSDVIPIHFDVILIHFPWPEEYKTAAKIGTRIYTVPASMFFFVGQLPDIEAEACRVRVYVRKRPLFDYEKEAETWQHPKDFLLKHSSRAVTA